MVSPMIDPVRSPLLLAATALARLHRGLTAQSHLIDDLLAASRTADSKGAGLGATFVVELPLLHAYRSETPLTLGGLR
jgi:hypothetical protein